MNFDYVAFLKLLVKLGPKAPVIYQQLAIIVNALKIIRDTVMEPTAIGYFQEPLTPELIALEDDALLQINPQVIGAPGQRFERIGSGNLRQLFATLMQFAKEHPELVKLLLTLITIL